MATQPRSREKRRLSWVPSDLAQAEARLHRVGTKDNVLVQHLGLLGSLDAIMVRRLIKAGSA